jgi:hypothetical protein
MATNAPYFLASSIINFTLYIYKVHFNIML